MKNNNKSNSTYEIFSAQSSSQKATNTKNSAMQEYLSGLENKGNHDGDDSNND